MSKKKGYIKLSWQGIHDEYIIEYSTDNQNWQYLATVKATTYTHTNLDPDTLYYYRVWGVKNGIKSVLPATISGYAKDLTPPTIPSIDSIVPTDKGFIIRLQPNTDPDFDSFEIHVSTTPNFTPSSSTLKAKGYDTVFYIGDLSIGAVYYVKVVACDKSGNSSISTEQSVTPTPPPTYIHLVYSTYSTSSDTYVVVPNTYFIYDSKIHSSNVRWGAKVIAVRKPLETLCTATLALWDVTSDTEVDTISYADIEGSPPPNPDRIPEHSVNLTHLHMYCLKLKIYPEASGTGYVHTAYIRFL